MPVVIAETKFCPDQKLRMAPMFFSPVKQFLEECKQARLRGFVGSGFVEQRGQVVIGVDAVGLAGFDQRGHARPGSAALVMTGEQRVFSILDSRGSSNVATFSELLHDAMDRLEARLSGEHSTDGLFRPHQ